MKKSIFQEGNDDAKEIKEGGPNPRYNAEAVARARAHWRNLTDDDLKMYHTHYTTGAGAGLYANVRQNSSFNEYLVESANESAHDKTLDL